MKNVPQESIQKKIYIEKPSKKHRKNYAPQTMHEKGQLKQTTLSNPSNKKSIKLFVDDVFFVIVDCLIVLLKLVSNK